MAFTILGIGLLTWITFLPILGMVIVLVLPKNNNTVTRWTSLAVTILQVVLAGIIFMNFNRGMAGINSADTMQFKEALHVDRHQEHFVVRAYPYRLFCRHRRHQRADGSSHGAHFFCRRHCFVED